MSKTDKSIHTVSVSEVINASIEDVWQNVAVNFGAVSLANPTVVSSYAINDVEGEGAARVCNLDDSGKKVLKERISFLDKANHTFGIDVYEINGLPLDKDYTEGIIKLEHVNSTQTRFNMTFNYRTKPAFLGAVMKGTFQRGLHDFALSIEHHLNTGEEITKENIKAIRKNRVAA